MIVSSPTFRVIFPPFSLSFFTLLDHYYHTVSSILFPVLFISHIYTIQYVSNQKERIIFTNLTHINIIFVAFLHLPTSIVHFFLSYSHISLLSFFPPSFLPSFLLSLLNTHVGTVQLFISLLFCRFLWGNSKYSF